MQLLLVLTPEQAAPMPSPCMQVAIAGMTCSSCSSAIESRLVRLPGVTIASVGLLTNSAEVSRFFFGPGQETVAVRLHVLAEMQVGWTTVTGPLLHQVTFEPQQVQPAAICGAVSAMGYGAELTGVRPVGQDRRAARLQACLQ